MPLHEVDLGSRPAVARLMAKLRPAYVFHTAAHSSRGYEDPLENILADDILALAHLADTATFRGLRRFIHVGSSLEYGPSMRPLRESDLPAPETLRGVMKSAATQIFLRKMRAVKLPGVVIRPFHVYGPWESPDRLVPCALQAALRGRSLALTPTGSGVRDPVFVDDLVEAILRAAVETKAVGEVINVGGGRGISNEALVEIIGRVTGRRLRVRNGAFPSREHDAMPRVANIAKARRLLDWRPRTSLPEGIAITAHWMRGRLPKMARGRRGAK